MLMLFPFIKMQQQDIHMAQNMEKYIARDAERGPRTSLHNHSIYGTFAATRLELSRRQLVTSGRFDPERRFWFSNFALHIAILIIMIRWYTDGRGTPLALLMSQMPTGHTTARGLLESAVELGYLKFSTSEQDKRRKILVPTEITIALWQTYFEEAVEIMRGNGFGAMLMDEFALQVADTAKSE